MPTAAIRKYSPQDRCYSKCKEMFFFIPVFLPRVTISPSIFHRVRGVLPSILNGCEVCAQKFADLLAREAVRMEATSLLKIINSTQNGFVHVIFFFREACSSLCCDKKCGRKDPTPEAFNPYTLLVGTTFSWVQLMMCGFPTNFGAGWMF